MSAHSAAQSQKRPWLALYAGARPVLEPPPGSALDMFAATAALLGDRPFIHYDGRTLSFADADSMSDALACALIDLGVQPGDRVAVCLQNVPQFPLALLAIWKAQAIAASVSPLLRAPEIEKLFADCAPSALIVLDDLHREAEPVLERFARCAVVTTSADDLSSDRRVVSGDGDPRRGQRFMDLIERHAGRRPPASTLAAGDVAVLTYTSGTTGPAKGAMNTHGNVVFTSCVYRDWMQIGPEDVILGLAPLFHVTGLIGHVGVALLTGAPLVLARRFDVEVTATLIDRWKPTFTIAAITAWIALMGHEELRGRGLGRLSKAFTGGAAVPAATQEAFEAAFGVYLHNAYGLTETTSPALVTPLGQRGPIDATTGALSVGIPVFNTDAAIVDDAGRPLGPGEAGELVVSGPQVVPGYWNNPAETAHAMPEGRLHTGDVAVMDEQGWFFVIDRKKDLINASGYKVWPRDVEEVLYAHSAVREAAVVGEPDAYRGETVVAYVVLQPGQTATADELIAHCRERMAAYKYPRRIEILEQLPKTASGKILRRALRDRAPQGRRR